MSNRRMAALAIGLVLAAAPILWMDFDPTAGDKLLRWVGSAPASPSAVRPPTR